MLYNKLLAIRWIRLRVMSDDSDRKALMSNPDITRNLNAAEVEFALEESHGPITGEFLSSEKESCEVRKMAEESREFPTFPRRRSMNFITSHRIVTEDRRLYARFIRSTLSIIFHLSLFFVIVTRIFVYTCHVQLIKKWLGNERGNIFRNRWWKI